MRLYMQQQHTGTVPIDLVWEVAEIARVIGRSERQTFHLLQGNQLPARKVGGRWVAERGQLVRFFMEPANEGGAY